MKIQTNQPLNKDVNKINKQIAQFWDKVSQAWHNIWGLHIHHGYFDNRQAVSPQQAQEQLIENLAALITIDPNDKILDAGCGMGGSSLYLAKKFNVEVCGISLSPEQIKIASDLAANENSAKLSFKVEDALSLSSFADNSFDIVWSLESCEQFNDKPLFLQQAFRVLKPGGQLLLATWCSDREVYENKDAVEYKKLCQEFNLPYMPTLEYYRSEIKKQGLMLKKALNWTMYVEKSWDIGMKMVSKYSWFELLKISGLTGLRFARQLKLMQKAYLHQRIKYGVFVASK